jgi:hypothetical protein
LFSFSLALSFSYSLASSSASSSRVMGVREMPQNTTPIFTLSVRKAVFMGTRKEAQFQENAGYGSAGQGQPLFLEECKTF